MGPIMSHTKPFLIDAWEILSRKPKIPKQFLCSPSVVPRTDSWRTGNLQRLWRLPTAVRKARQPVFSSQSLIKTETTRPFITATCGYRPQRHENPFDGAQVEEGDDPFEEKVESNISAPTWPQFGHTAWSLSSILRHKYSKLLPQTLHLNSWIGMFKTLHSLTIYFQFP